MQFSHNKSILVGPSTNCNGDIASGREEAEK